MNIKKIKAAIQSILFASGDPVSIDRISMALDIEKPIIVKIMGILKDEFDREESGLCIIKIDDKYQMCTKPVYSQYVRKAIDLRKNVPLSQAAMEVLAIVAYNQPVTKSFIEQVRGVDCSNIISNLNLRCLIEEKGRLELPGKPILYGTTLNFLKCFGINSIDELPEICNKK